MLWIIGCLGLVRVQQQRRDDRVVNCIVMEIMVGCIGLLEGVSLLVCLSSLIPMSEDWKIQSFGTKLSLIWSQKPLCYQADPQLMPPPERLSSILPLPTMDTDERTQKIPSLPPLSRALFVNMRARLRVPTKYCLPLGERDL